MRTVDYKVDDLGIKITILEVGKELLLKSEWYILLE